MSEEEIGQDAVKSSGVAPSQDQALSDAIAPSPSLAPPAPLFAAQRDRRYPYSFKSQRLREAYERLLDDPDARDLSEELAMARLLVLGMASRVKAIEPENLTASEVAAIAAMLDEVCRVADAMARIEAKLQVTISVTQLAMVTDQAARLFYQELRGIVGMISGKADRETIEDEIPRALERIGKALEGTSVPFSPARWARERPGELPPASTVAGELAAGDPVTGRSGDSA